MISIVQFYLKNLESFDNFNNWIKIKLYDIELLTFNFFSNVCIFCGIILIIHIIVVDRDFFFKSELWLNYGQSHF